MPEPVWPVGYLFIQYYELWLPFWGKESQSAVGSEDDLTMVALPPFLGARVSRFPLEGKHKLFMHYARAMLNMSPDKIKNNKAFEHLPWDGRSSCCPNQEHSAFQRAFFER